MFFYHFLQFKERKRYFNTLECLFCYSYYILHNKAVKHYVNCIYIDSDSNNFMIFISEI